MVWMGDNGQSTPDVPVGLIQGDGNTTSTQLENDQNVRNSPMETVNIPILQYMDMGQDSQDLLLAYQSNTGPSCIPIQEDGIGVCEKCGAIAVKHAFYAKERRFCSMTCARGYCSSVSESMSKSPGATHYTEHIFKIEDQENYEDLVFEQPLPQLITSSQQPTFGDSTLAHSIVPKVTDSYCWDPQLLQPDFVAAPVTCFKQHPLCDIWHNIKVGMKVEVKNTDSDRISDVFPDSFWVATVIQIAGYRGLLRYEGFDDDSKDFWMSLCSDEIHPIGWCATNGKPLIPPLTVRDKHDDWRDFLRKRLIGTRTLPSDFTSKVIECSKSRFRCGLNLEVVDKHNISQVKFAVIHKIIGKRLNIKYFDMPADDVGFWCHEDSHLLHPVGWARNVGHQFAAPENHLKRIISNVFDENYARHELFTQIQKGPNFSHVPDDLCVGMKLEAIDPLDLTSICVATIMEVLNCGYVMIRIETYDTNIRRTDWFCYHISSPCIFPAGFCEKNGIPLQPPKGYDLNNFTWEEYINKTKTRVVDEKYFNRHVPSHGFAVGMKVEAVDLMDPQLVCAATISKVVGRLLRVHFDGWKDDYDQWMDCESPDIYPVGWCQSVGYKLEGPPVIKQTPFFTVRKAPRRTGWSGKKRKLTHNILKKKLKDRYTSGNTKIIPRLSDSAEPAAVKELCPNEWDIIDVAQFLRVNDCGNYCSAFYKRNINGKILLNLNKDHILEIADGKIGPSLKILDLIDRLKIQCSIDIPHESEGNDKSTP